MSGTTDPESEIIKREREGMLIEATIRLSDENRIVFKLFIGGFSEADIAKLFGTTEDAVRGRLSRSKKFVTEYVQKRENGTGGGPIFKNNGVGAV